MIGVKICGISTRETMQTALDAGATMVGLVFFARSPRNVSLEMAIDLANQARGRAKIVALIVDADDGLIKAIATNARPDYFQAHGNETPGRIAEIRDRFAIPVIKAIKVSDAADVEAAQIFSSVAAMLLYDAKAPASLANALPGGNGLCFDWSLLPHGPDVPDFMLSGGLTPDNVAEAVRQTSAAIVDVSSGVESAPGVKDHQLVRKFIEAARQAR